jgi:uncharacterized membrane protein YphA (DoxX/SURF4 family)
VTTALAALRTLVGLAFVVAGVVMFAKLGRSVGDFARWGLPVPGIVAVLVSAVQIVCGGLLAAGALTRPVGLLLATLMVGATLTAGRTDGGVYAIAPPILFALCVFFAWRAARFPGLGPARRPGVQ